MMEGRPPTPTSLKILNGNPGKRPLNNAEPHSKLTKPRCPDHLDEIAQEEWKRVARILMRMRVLTEADQVMLGIWCCDLQHDGSRHKNQLKQVGTLYKSKGGFVQVSPLFGIVNKCVHILSKISLEFGLTPSGLECACTPCPNPSPRRRVVRSRLNECERITVHSVFGTPSKSSQKRSRPVPLRDSAVSGRSRTVHERSGIGRSMRTAATKSAGSSNAYLTSRAGGRAAISSWSRGSVSFSQPSSDGSTVMDSGAIERRISKSQGRIQRARSLQHVLSISFVRMKNPAPRFILAQSPAIRHGSHGRSLSRWFGANPRCGTITASRPSPIVLRYRETPPRSSLI